MEIPSFLFIGIYITNSSNCAFYHKIKPKTETFSKSFFFSMSSLEIYTWQCFPGSGTAKNLRMAAKMSGSFRLREYIPTKNATLHHVRLINMESPWIPPQKMECLLLLLDFQARKNTMVHMSRWFKPLNHKLGAQNPPRPPSSTQDLWGLPKWVTSWFPRFQYHSPITLAVLFNWFLNWMPNWLRKQKQVNRMQILNLLHQVRFLESLGSNPWMILAWLKKEQFVTGV